MATRVSGYIYFNDRAAHEIVEAALELQKAGYEVHCMPEKYRQYRWWPTDRYLEVIIAGRDTDAVWKEVSAIVFRYGGEFDDCGTVESDYVPSFAWMFTGNIEEQSQPAEKLCATAEDMLLAHGSDIGSTASALAAALEEDANRALLTALVEHAYRQMIDDEVNHHSLLVAAAERYLRNIQATSFHDGFRRSHADPRFRGRFVAECRKSASSTCRVEKEIK
jgi:hypothetical protein